MDSSFDAEIIQMTPSYHGSEVMLVVITSEGNFELPLKKVVIKGKSRLVKGTNSMDYVIH
jgi:hypothetical protein